MEYTFIADYDYECPYCHQQLEDEGEERVCKNETCKGRFRTFTTIGEK